MRSGWCCRPPRATCSRTRPPWATSCSRSGPPAGGWRPGAGGRPGCWTRSGSARSRTGPPGSCPAASSNGSRSRSRAGMATLEARGLAYTRDGQQILSRVSVSVHPGERLAITGPSGSGKTSLLTLLAGLDTPSSGEVYIDGIRLTGVAGPGQGVALVLQGYGLVSLLTAAENIEVALRAAGRAPSEAAAAARETLGQVGLGAHADHLVEE